jgi:hypothetical protein
MVSSSAADTGKKEGSAARCGAEVEGEAFLRSWRRRRSFRPRAASARVVYADNDPIVLRHAEALLHSTPEGRTAYIQADAREPGKILAAAKETLDFEQPIALSLVALLHLVADDDDPYRIVGELLKPLAAGSYLALSHATGDFDPKTWERVVEVYRKGGTPATVRSRSEFSRFFEGLELIDPGIELAALWHPELGEQHSQREQIPLYVEGVARTR